MRIRPTTSTRLISLLLLAGVLLTGCPSNVGPIAPGEEYATETPFASDPSRSAEALIQGSVTLQGATTTDPASYTAPFIATLPGKSGEIALVALGTDQLDTPGSGNRVLYTLKAGTSTLLSKNYIADTTPDHQPVLLLNNEPLKLSLYNSELATSTLYSKRIRWYGSIQTVRKEDIDEPNDDENQATRTDRTMGAALAENTPIDRSFYRRTAVTAEDIEDWYAINVNAGQAYVVDFTNQNGVWSTFTFVLRVVDGAGNTVAFFSNHKTAGLRQLSFVPTTTGTYYLQVYGSPSTRKGTSVYYAPYQLQYRPVAAPQVTSVSLQDVVVAVGTSIPVSATFEGEVTSYNWDLGNGFRPTTDTRASFTDSPVEPGVHQGSLTVSGPWGTSAPYNFSYQIMPTSPWWFDDLPEESQDIGSLIPYWTTDLPDGRCGMVVGESTSGTNAYWFYYSGPNGNLRDWTFYRIGPPTGNSAVVGTTILGNLTFVNSANEYYRATTALPTSSADWYISSIPLASLASWRSLHNIGSRLGMAYSNFNDAELHWVYASTANPAPADWTEYIIDGTGPVGYGLAGTKYRNRPALAYLEGAGVTATHTPVLRYARAKVGAPLSAADWTLSTISETGIGELDEDVFSWAYDREMIETPSGLLVVGPTSTGVHLAWSTVQEPASPGDWNEGASEFDFAQAVYLGNPGVKLVGNQVYLAMRSTIGNSSGVVVSSAQMYPWAPGTSVEWVESEAPFVGARSLRVTNWTAHPESSMIMIGHTIISSTSRAGLWRPVQ